jgi:thiol-disulfide isomerase/thioredoxin
MRNNHFLKFFLIGLAAIFSFTISAQSELFKNYDLSEAKIEALKQKKKIYLHFTASWCMPCKWMDENTYKDPQVIESLNENFIPIKINIEETEGKTFKSNFGVTILPTIMITDHLAKPLIKAETSMSAEQLVAWIQQNPLDVFPEPTPDLMEVKEFFTIQTGVFNEEKNAISYQNELWNQYQIESQIITEDIEKSRVFRVVSGKYATRDEAVEKILSLKKLGINGILKTLN